MKYKRILPLLFLLFIGRNCIAQQSIKHFTELVSLDTILFFNDFGSDALSSKLKKRITGDTCYINYYNNDIHKDTFFITKINLKNKKITKNLYVLPNFQYALLDERQRIRDFDINSKNLVILVNNTLFHLSLETNILAITQLDELSEFRQIKLLNNNLILAKSYNSFNPFHEIIKTEIALFNLQTSKVTYSIKPHITNIELTHFPINPISFFNDKIIVAQNYNYSFTIYDSNLNVIQTVYDFKSFENKLDSNKIRKQYKKGLSNFSNFVRQHFFTSGMLESCAAIDTNTFIVIYNDGKNKNEESRLIDVWKKDSVTGQFIFTNKTYLNNYITYFNTLFKDSSFILSKDNYFEYLNEGKFEWNNNWYLKFSTSAKIYPIGNSLKELYYKRNNYYKTEKPVTNVSIFKCR